VTFDANFTQFAGAAIDVSFVVTANGGSSTDDISLWVHPRIVER
jgi:hypothetical protein